jgi:beta-lactamase superfamily II metal-dependent hydrolase
VRNALLSSQALFSVVVVGLLAATWQPVHTQARDVLNISFIDTEGGQATLFVTPAGESLLIDTGFPGNQDRDADRIVAAAKKAGVSQIDYLIVTHYHLDHVGGVPALAAKIPIKTFVDHGPSVETDERGVAMVKAYTDLRDKATHLLVKPGDVIPIKGVEVRVVAAGGEQIARPLDGVRGGPNLLCATYKGKEADPSENARSVGVLITFGRFRMLDLGDLTWNKELDLVCPENRLGNIDLYLTTHHGLDQSNAPVIVHSLKPRVAVMNNGANKGGSVEAWTTVNDSPGLEGFWQLHTAVKGGKEHNVPDAFIANLDETTGHGIGVAVNRDGSFVVTNARNNESRTYKAR